MAALGTELMHNYIFCNNFIGLAMSDSIGQFVFLDPKTGHYPGAVNIPFASLFNPDTKMLRTVDELKKGNVFPMH